MENRNANRANPRVAWTLFVAAALGFATALSSAVTDGGQGPLVFAVITGALVLLTGAYAIYVSVAASRRNPDEAEDSD